MIVYRILRSSPPETSDYLTAKEMGRKIYNPTPELERMATGYSVLISLEAAHKHAQRRPWLGVGYIGIYDLTDNAKFTLEQTGVNLSHYTLWCSAEYLHACLTDVLPIKEDLSDV